MDPSQEPPTRLELLARMAARGREEKDRAWQDFVQTYSALIYCWCRARKLPEADVQDVTQEVCMRVYHYFSTYDPNKGRFRPWLRAIVGNACRDCAKQWKRQPRGTGDSAVHELLENQAAQDDLSARLEGLPDSKVVDRAVEKVSAECPEPMLTAYRLTVKEGLPVEEVARRQGVDPAKVSDWKRKVWAKVVREITRSGDGADRPAAQGPPQDRGSP
jgi:RNA polymerase sigma factor (sigma-70 family)